MKKVLLAALAALIGASQASAQLVITEVRSGPADTTPDWFELTNFGAVAIDPTGYKMDDSSNNIANAVDLLGISSIAPGESVVYLENSDPPVVLPQFRNFWTGSGTGLPGVQIGSYSGSGVGLSSTNGDEVHVFDAGGTVIASATFPMTTVPQSFGFNPNTMTFGAFSVAGQFGAFNSAGTPIETASPGTIVPEPASLALAGLALLGLRRRRRR